MCDRQGEKDSRSYRYRFSPALEDINRVCVEAFDQAEGKQYSFLDDYTEERSERVLEHFVTERLALQSS